MVGEIFLLMGEQVARCCCDKVPGHEWPGYGAAPDESGLSPIDGM